MEMSSAWAMFLLLAGSQVRVTHSWNFRDEGKGIESYFLATVEYALHIFNVKSKDTNAYRLVSILDSQREEVETLIAFSMELKLRRTRCGKFDEDIDNCPFEENPELNNTFICFFTISIDPWRTVFQLLNKTCLAGTY
ncbi:cystatin-9-like [Myotis myotis]|uniref:cystatin-9-like n=1 Tax=Myotis myotis TaxID=51298 RepID=UPI0017485E17|nr:cystatin-9-like [Myotis myotis]